MGVPTDSRCSFCLHPGEYHAPDGCRFWLASMLSAPPGPCGCPQFNWPGPQPSPERVVGLFRDNVLDFRPREK